MLNRRGFRALVALAAIGLVAAMVPPVFSVIANVATPTFRPSGGVFCKHSVSVIISSTTSGASIRYTIDGSTPTSTHGRALANGGTVSVSPGPTRTLKAIACKSGMTNSAVRSGSYEYDCGQ